MSGRPSRTILFVAFAIGIAAVALGAWARWRPIGALLALSGERGHIDTAKLALVGEDRVGGPRIGLFASQLLVRVGDDNDDTPTTASFDGAFGLSLYRGYDARVALADALHSLQVAAGQASATIGRDGVTFDGTAGIDRRVELQPGRLRHGLWGELGRGARLGEHVRGLSIDAEGIAVLRDQHIVVWPAQLFPTRL